MISYQIESQSTSSNEWFGNHQAKKHKNKIKLLM